MSESTYKIKRLYTELGEYLRLSRVRADLTQRHVSLALGYSSSQFISNFERGIAMPPLEKLRAMIKMYRIPCSRVVNLAMVGEKKKIVSRMQGGAA